MWLKYRCKWSHGADKDWEYQDLGDILPDKEYEILREEAEKWNWSEHWRGFDYELIDSPPKEYLEDLRKTYQIRIRSLRKQIKRVAKQIRDCEK